MKRSMPYLLVAVSTATGILVLLPVTYLIHKAFAATGDGLMSIVLRIRNLKLLLNTLLLMVGVLGVTSLIAIPLAWCTTRTDLWGKRLWSILAILPLAIPSYLIAYTLLSLGGYYGPLKQLFGWSIQRMDGYTGALCSLSLYTFPYLYLNLRAAFLGIDPAQEEAARTLGARGFGLFWRVTLSQLKPAYLAGTFLIGLHVLADFGTVSLMRYETFSYALYLQYSAALDQTYSAWLSLMMLVLTFLFLVVEWRLVRNAKLYYVGRGSKRIGRILKLGIWQFPVILFCVLILGAALLLPTGSIIYWACRGADLDWNELLAALWNSVSVAAPAAFLASSLAIPIAILSVRYQGSLSSILERATYLGYATPGLAFGLGFLFFSLRSAFWLHQSVFLLVGAYTLHFLAEAIGPVRTALHQAPPVLEEAARTLGSTRLQAFWKITVPVLQRGFIVSTAFVFLAVMKELPITYILSPLDRETLAVAVWGYIDEAMFAEAAPYALAILVFSSLFVGALLLQEKRTC
ncbi:MAG: ABC transporter permease [Planctomycetota bacterium]|jgi:iron(III) transport system permease protein